MFRSAVFASLLLAASAASAADLGAKKPTPAAPAISGACKETKALPTEAHGFATGSDVFDLNTWGTSLDNIYVGGGRGGRSYAYTGLLQVSGSFFPCLEVGPYALYTIAGFKPYGGVERQGTILGGGIEIKYKLFGRATDGFGVTAVISPNAGRYTGSSIYGGRDATFGNSYRLLVDRELVQDKLWGVLNLELYQAAYENTLPGFRNTSQFNVRTALTAAINDSLYLGGEASFQFAQAGLWLNGPFRATAAYIGPTFQWNVTEKAVISGTWAYQFYGNDKSGPNRELGTLVFPLHQVRVKLAYNF